MNYVQQKVPGQNSAAHPSGPPGMSFGAPFFGNWIGTYKTGMEQGPIWNQQQVQQGQQQIQNAWRGAPGMAGSPGSSPNLQRFLGGMRQDRMRSQGAAQGQQFGREAAMANANELLRSQVDASQNALRRMGNATNAYGENMNNQNFWWRTLMGLMGGAM